MMNMRRSYAVVDSGVDLHGAFSDSGFLLSPILSPAHISYFRIRRSFGSALLLYTRQGGILRLWLSTPKSLWPGNALVWIAARRILRRLGARAIPFRELRRTLGKSG